MSPWQISLSPVVFPERSMSAQQPTGTLTTYNLYICISYGGLKMYVFDRDSETVTGKGDDMQEIWEGLSLYGMRSTH